MPGYTLHPYRGHAYDAHRAIAFLSEINRHPRFVADYYAGDFVWRSFRAPEASARDSIALWQNASEQIAAIGFFDAPAEFSYAVHPGVAGTPDEIDSVMGLLAWAEAKHEAGHGEVDKPLGVMVRTDHDAIQRMLSERGYRVAGDPRYAGNVRRLDDPVAAPTLPADFEILAMTDEADLRDRVEIHREVWAPSKFTPNAYAMLRDAPVYRQDLDLAIRAPDGRFASYLIGWWDPAAKSGLLEPVGARLIPAIRADEGTYPGDTAALPGARCRSGVRELVSQRYPGKCSLPLRRIHPGRRMAGMDPRVDEIRIGDHAALHRDAPQMERYSAPTARRGWRGFR